MILKKRLVGRGGALLLAAAGGVALAPAAAAAVPSCVSATASHVGKYGYVTVHNRCSSTQRFIIAWNNALDSDCLSLAPQTSLTRSKIFSDFQGLKDC